MHRSSGPAAPNTLFVGQVWLRLKEIHSTNSYLKELVEQGRVREGTAVSASFQTAGRGQRGSQWNSLPDQNILLSVLFTPQFLPLAEQFLLSQTFALAVRDVLARELPAETIFIKWPNDIYVRGKKISGMLIENSLAGQTIQNCIFGVGINVNQLEELLPTATSLAALSGRQYQLNRLIGNLLEGLEARYLQLRAGKQESIRREYEAYLLGFNELLTFTDASESDSFSGIIRGVTRNGQLLLERDGRLLSYNLKEIRML